MCKTQHKYTKISVHDIAAKLKKISLQNNTLKYETPCTYFT